MSQIFNIHDINITGQEAYFNENVTFFKDVNIGGDLNVSGLSTFGDNALFKKDVTIDGKLEIDFLTVKTSFDVGVGGTVFTADTRTDRVGIFTSTPVQKFQFNSEQENTVVITGLGTVGIGTINPGVGVTSLNDSTQGKLSLDLETLSVRRNIYDSSGSPGPNGAFLNRDEFGVRWVTFEPAFSEGIFVQDEGRYISSSTDPANPYVGAAQSFTVLNFRQINSLGLGTDTLIPIADVGNPKEIVRIQTQDLWGYVGTGDNASIYRMSNVGIGSSAPTVALDVIGNSGITGILTIGQDAFVGASLSVTSNTFTGGILTVGQDAFVGASLSVTSNTFTGGILTVGQDAFVGASLSVTSNTFTGGILTVTGNTFLDSALDVDGATTLNNTLDVDGATTLNNTLDVDGATTLNNTLDVDGATTLNNTLDVDLGTTLNNTLDVDGKITSNDTTAATSSTSSASVQIDGGVAIAKNLYVGDELVIEDQTQSINKDTGALVVDGGVGIEKNLNVGGNTKLTGSLELDSTLIDINGSVALGKTDYRLSSVGTGVSWRPPGVETKNTIWVSKDGNDSNSGFLEGDAKATVGAAAAVALEGDTIKIRPGRYEENNPIGLRNDVSITGEDIRLVTIQPLNTSLDVFWVRRGCLIENLNFAGGTVGVEHGPNAGAVAFPVTGATANSGYTPGGPATQGSSKRWRSPYVRNCTNFMTKSIGMRINGDDAGKTADAENGADLKSMVCDSFTQYNEAGIGVSLTNNAYAQLVSIFTINNDIAVYADTGAQCDLTNSNSSFGNFGLVAVGLGATQYTGIISNTNPAGELITSTNPEEQDTVVAAGVTDSTSESRRPFDGQAAYFKIDLDNYPDAVGTGRITAPLQDLASIKILNGGTPGQFSQSNPPDVIIRDADTIITPKGPQGIVAEASVNVSLAGTITSIDVINSGRNYLPTQNIVVDVEGNTGLATAVMEPIYFTVSEATDNREGTTGNTSGITTITFNEFIPYELFPDDPLSLQRISRILTSSHSFEYVGSGTSINTSLPFEGAQTIKENEIVFREGAQIPFTSTDQKGNFDIGVGLQIDQVTSTIRGRDFSKAIQAEVTPLILALR